MKDGKSKGKDDLQFKKGNSIVVTRRVSGRLFGSIKGSKKVKEGWIDAALLQVVPATDDGDEETAGASTSSGSRKELRKKVSTLGRNKDKDSKDKDNKDKEVKKGSQKNEPPASAPAAASAAPVAASAVVAPAAATASSSAGMEYGSRRQRAGTLEAALTLRPNAHKLLQAGILKPTKNIPVYAVPLGQLMYISYTEFEIPDVFLDCDRTLRAGDALRQEGIFRISGQMDELQAIKKGYDIGQPVDLSGYSCHSVSGALKLFFRELPEALMTYALYTPLLKTVSMPDDGQRVAATMEILRHMPPHNAALLKMLMSLLVATNVHQAVNLMTTANLGIVFGPTLLRPEKEDAGMFLDSSKQADVVDFMIRRFDEVFANVRVPLPLT